MNDKSFRSTESTSPLKPVSVTGIGLMKPRLSTVRLNAPKSVVSAAWATLTRAIHKLIFLIMLILLLFSAQISR